MCENSSRPHDALDANIYLLKFTFQLSQCKHFSRAPQNEQVVHSRLVDDIFLCLFKLLLFNFKLAVVFVFLPYIQFLIRGGLFAFVYTVTSNGVYIYI